MTVRLEQVPAGDGFQLLASRAAELLDAGGVLALPTETVYGLCCRSSRHDAVERVFQAKGRPRDKPLPYLLPDAAGLETFVNDVPATARRLAERLWPGPLTLVLGPEPGVALRVPDHSFTRDVLRRADGPVNGTSANRSGEQPAVTAAAVAEGLGAQVDLVLDGGPASLGRASSVVRVDAAGAWRSLREEALSASVIQEAVTATLLLVCTGNTCRSPMAAAALRSRFAAELGCGLQALPSMGVRVLSAGVGAQPGAHISANAARALEQAGIPVPEHRAQSASETLLQQADLVLTLAPSHLGLLAERHPDLRPRLQLLDPLGSGIADPIGGDLGVYQESLAAIQEALDARLPDLLALVPRRLTDAAPGRGA